MGIAEEKKRSDTLWLTPFLQTVFITLSCQSTNISISNHYFWEPWEKDLTEDLKASISTKADPF